MGNCNRRRSARRLRRLRTERYFRVRAHRAFPRVCMVLSMRSIFSSPVISGRALSKMVLQTRYARGGGRARGEPADARLGWRSNVRRALLSGFERPRRSEAATWKTPGRAPTRSTALSSPGPSAQRPRPGASARPTAALDARRSGPPCVTRNCLLLPQLQLRFLKPVISVTSTCVSKVLKPSTRLSKRHVYLCPAASPTACPRPWCCERPSDSRYGRRVIAWCIGALCAGCTRPRAHLGSA